jgi:hypothetical protein
LTKASRTDDQPPFDWNRFESMFGAGFPFQGGTPWNNPLDVEQLVGRTSRKQADLAQTSVIEKDRFIHVKIMPPRQTRPEDLRVFATRHVITLQGGAGVSPVTVKLPVAVSLKKYQAVWKEGSLHLRLRKVYVEDLKQELFIEY